MFRFSEKKTDFHLQTDWQKRISVFKRIGKKRISVFRRIGKNGFPSSDGLEKTDFRLQTDWGEKTGFPSSDGRVSPNQETTTTTLPRPPSTTAATHPTGESNFGAVLEHLPAVIWRVGGGHQVPGVRVVLAEQPFVLSVPHQLHPDVIQKSPSLATS